MTQSSSVFSSAPLFCSEGQKSVATKLKTAAHDIPFGVDWKAERVSNGLSCGDGLKADLTVLIQRTGNDFANIQGGE